MAFITPTSVKFSTGPKSIRKSPRHRPSATVTAPAQVVLSPLPNLLVYDHCPFCVRVRYVLGLKNIKHNLIWLLNDDATTPTSLVGKKIVPIFQPHGSGGSSQMESLDICAAIDSDPRYGETNMLQPASGRVDIKNWFDELAMPLRRLTRVRFSRAPLPEFTFEDGKAAYIRNHPLVDPDSYDENWNRSEEYIAQVRDKLPELEKLIWSNECCSEGGIGYDDVDLFPRLRSLTIVDGLELGGKLEEYVKWMAERVQIPLYDYCAM